MSKGSTRRPSQIPQKEFNERWDRIFFKDKKCWCGGDLNEAGHCKKLLKQLEERT